MIHFFWGDEDFDIEKAIEQQKKGLDKTFAAMNFKTYDNPSFADLVAVLRSQPMMFGKMLVVINCEKLFAREFDENELKEIDSALENNPEMLDIVFVALYPRGEGKKPDSRKKLFKILSKYDTKNFESIRTYKTAEIANRVNKMAKDKDITIDQKAMNTLIEHLGSNMRDFDRELNKLKLLAYPQKMITSEMVHEICISNEDLFVFTDLVMKGEKAQALLELRRLLQKQHMLQIVAALQTFLKKWITIKLKSGSMTDAEIGQQIKLHEFVVKKTRAAMAKTPLKELVKLKENLLEAEYRLKSGKARNEIEEFENAVLR